MPQGKSAAKTAKTAGKAKAAAKPGKRGAQKGSKSGGGATDSAGEDEDEQDFMFGDSDEVIHGLLHDNTNGRLREKVGILFQVQRDRGGLEEGGDGTRGE